MEAAQIQDEVVAKAKQAREAARLLASLPTRVKDKALLAMADALEERQQFVLQANAADVRRAQDKALGAAFVDRLLLSEKRIAEMATGLREVAALPDPVGEVVAGWRRPNGLEIRKIRVPLGVIGIIYESRPNVTVDAAGLCLKAGNAVLLRGGSEAIESNTALVRVIAQAASRAGVPEGAIRLIETTDRAAAEAMMRLNEYVDVLIPRGGAGLIQTVVNTATIPVIETGIGVCHVFVDQSADLDMAEAIVVNAKCQRPGVCNAMETLLVHKAVAGEFLPRVVKNLIAQGVEIRGCERSRRRLHDFEVGEATEDDWRAEYLALVLAVRLVDDLDQAVDHIAAYGSGHSEAIVTRDFDNARTFCDRVDAAAVYVNASTRFTDGGQFGLGAEIGISTQKLHARGPMGLRELTSTKFVVFGDGQLRS